MINLSKLNALEAPAFSKVLGGIYEHSPWVAQRSFEQRPFAKLPALVDVMQSVVDASTDAEKLTLIRSHPDLAGKLARSGSLTLESTREQAGLGLDQLTDNEFQRFSDLNTRYHERFGFPFIICARLTTKDGVLTAFETRLQNTPDQEISAALTEIHHIARLRLEDLLSTECT